MASPSPGSDPADRRGHRPSQHLAVPPDVSDPLLWALAVDVTAAHRPDADGTCTNPQCRGQHGACQALRTAHRAARQARRPTGRPAAAPPPPLLPHRGGAARGRATVPTTAQRFTGWFTPPTTPPPAATTLAAPRPVPHPPFAFRRPPVAALVA